LDRGYSEKHSLARNTSEKSIRPVTTTETNKNWSGGSNEKNRIGEIRQFATTKSGTPGMKREWEGKMTQSGTPGVKREREGKIHRLIQALAAEEKLDS
jgi:hypothetical protein